MWVFLLSYRVVSVALPLLGVVAVLIGELVSPTIAYILVGVIALWLICAIIYWWRNKKKIQSKAMPNSIIVANTVNITINVKPEDIRGGGLTGKGNKVDSSTDEETG